MTWKDKQRRVGGQSRQRGFRGSEVLGNGWPMGCWEEGRAGGEQLEPVCGWEAWSDATSRVCIMLTRPEGTSGATAEVQGREAVRLNQKSGSSSDRSRQKPASRSCSVPGGSCHSTSPAKQVLLISSDQLFYFT